MKHLLTFLAIALSLPLFAQKTTAYVAIGGGLSTYDFELEYLTPVPSVGLAWRIGEKNNKGFSFTPALLYQWRAQTVEFDGGKAWVRSHLFSIEPNVQFRIRAGASLSLGYFHGISLYDEAGLEIDGQKETEKIILGDDIGAQGALGWDFKTFAIKVTYKHGLVNVSEGVYSRSFYFHLLWALPRSKK